MYTLLHLTWIINKDPMHSIRSSAQCYVVAWTGQADLGSTDTGMAESFCCSPETVTAWLIG